MLTRRNVYESHGFTCNPSYNSFDKEISEAECIELSATLERLKQRNEDFIADFFSFPFSKKRTSHI